MATVHGMDLEAVEIDQEMEGEAKMEMEEAMAKVLIAGCGYVGSALGTMLVADGHEVFGLRRSSDALPPGIKLVKADLTLPETLGAVPSGVDTIPGMAAFGLSLRAICCLDVSFAYHSSSGASW